ncbi:MAG: tetratricopeptide repeat protein [Elusimicrobia bacterium]|nr:tetratricopeptide repeat protein [Elusimicrobiota bacterium]
MIVLTLLVSPVYATPQFTRLDNIDAIQARLKSLGEGKRLRLRAKLETDLATLLYKSGKMEDAAAAYETALTLPTTKKMRRHIYLYMGKSYESSGRIDKAISAYEQALDYDPKNWRRHRDLAGLYEQAKLYHKAREEYSSARVLNPREPSVWFVSGRTYREMGLFKEAEPFLSKALDLGHDEHAVHRELSFVDEGRGRFATALNEWRQGAGDSADPADIARGIYLSVLSSDLASARTELGRLKAVSSSKDTVQLYENLIEWPPSGLDALLSSGGKFPELESLVASFLADKKTP